MKKDIFTEIMDNLQYSPIKSSYESGDSILEGGVDARKSGVGERERSSSSSGIHWHETEELFENLQNIKDRVSTVQQLF